MSLPFSQVRFRLYNADGTPAADLAVAARLTRPDIDAGVVVPANVVRGTSDTAGEATLFLWPNSRGTTSSQYAVVVSRGVKQVDSFTITVPESVGVVYAEDIRSAAPYPPVSAAQQAIESAQAAVVAASNASRLTIGTVATLGPGEPATAEIAGDPGAQTLSLGIPRGADGEGSGVGGSTNLAYTASPTGGTVTSDTGTDATIPLADGTNAGLMTPSQKATLDATSGTNTGDQDLSGYSLASHNHTGVYDPAGTAAGAVSSHEGEADPHPGYVLESTVGAAGGVTPLDGTGKVASAYLPSYVDDVVEAADFAAPPGPGEAGKIYVTLDNGKIWRWGGSAYAEISPSPGSTDEVTEGSANLYHTAARVLGQVLTGLSTAAGTVVTSAHTVLQAIGFLQKQASDNATAITGKQATLVSGTNIKTINSTSILGSGDITISGGSSNTRWIGAGELIPSVTSGAGIDAEETTTNKNNLDYLAFDASTAEYAQATFSWPSGFTTLTAKLHWTAASGSGAVVWTAAARCFADDDALDQAMGTAQSVTDTLLAATDCHITSATSTVTPGGTATAGNLCLIQIARDAANGSDTLAVDARLIGVEVTFE